MTEDQYGDLMKAIGRIEGRLESDGEKFTSNQITLDNMALKLDLSNSGLRKHLDRHKTGGKVLKYGGATLGIIATILGVIAAW